MTESEYIAHLEATKKQIEHEVEVGEMLLDLMTKDNTHCPQIAYANTRQGACQCFDDMTARGMKLDLVAYRYYWPLDKAKGERRQNDR